MLESFFAEIVIFNCMLHCIPYSSYASMQLLFKLIDRSSLVDGGEIASVGGYGAG
jgi:hypothetical protein